VSTTAGEQLLAAPRGYPSPHVVGGQNQPDRPETTKQRSPKKEEHHNGDIQNTGQPNPLESRGLPGRRRPNPPRRLHSAVGAASLYCLKHASSAEKAEQGENENHDDQDPQNAQFDRSPQLRMARRCAAVKPFHLQDFSKPDRPTLVCSMREGNVNGSQVVAPHGDAESRSGYRKPSHLK